VLAEEEKVEEPVDVEPDVEEEKMEDVNEEEGVEGVKVEENGEEDEMDDEEGLFSSEFENLMNPEGFSMDSEGFGDGLEWMSNM